MCKKSENSKKYDKNRNKKENLYKKKKARGQ